VRRALIVGLLGAALIAPSCGGGEETSDQAGADLQNGRDLFVTGEKGKAPCGSCHTLADAATLSTVGPSLDSAFSRMREEGFDDSTIFDITLAQIDLAEPPMPADLVTGQDAVDVAAYVASVAGKPPQQQPQEQGGATTGAETTTEATP
jgi:mono/diheme cytochrome c family protein